MCVCVLGGCAEAADPCILGVSSWFLRSTALPNAPGSTIRATRHYRYLGPPRSKSKYVCAMCTYIYIYIHIAREREREREMRVMFLLLCRQGGCQGDFRDPGASGFVFCVALGCFVYSVTTLV